MRCVVCDGAAAQPIYANAWEKARKLFACCSQTCADRFDPDQHWIPSIKPTLLDPEEEARLVRLGGERLRAGDGARLVTRDLLVAGVGVPGVRKALIHAALSAEATDKVATRVSVLGWIAAALGGAGTIAERRSQQDPAQLREAVDTDLARWADHFR
jgi:hypothetical protein